MGGGKLEARDLRKPSRFVGRERGRCFYAFAKSRIPRVSWEAEMGVFRVSTELGLRATYLVRLHHDVGLRVRMI